jgi:hypothetical protein
MRAIFARVLVALLMTSALVALRAGSGAHLAAPSREVSTRLLGREERGEPQREETNRPTRSPETRHVRTPRRRLCVIASHRPRVSGSPSSPGEPERFAAYLASWLPRAAKVPNGAFSVWVVEQADEYRFNRGWLMNVGVAVSRALDACDVFALHDVDLLPVDARLPYGAFPRVREVLAPSEGDGGAEASRRIADRTVDAAHLSPPGVHPEYVFRTFKGGAWLFTWDALVRADGYAHVYWGWGLEDDDLGARALAANLSVATRPFPVSTKNVSSASRRDVSLKASRDQCTGFARACAFDPTRTDCLADVPYDSFKKRAFAKTPRTTREGLIVPEGRTLADGVCFAHAHEGTFSRDALETNARRHPRLSPEFTRGRRWEDVRSGRFRADETTGLARLTPAGVLGDEGRDANGVSRTFEKRKKKRAARRRAARSRPRVRRSRSGRRGRARSSRGRDRLERNQAPAPGGGVRSGRPGFEKAPVERKRAFTSRFRNERQYSRTRLFRCDSRRPIRVPRLHAPARALNVRRGRDAVVRGRDARRVASERERDARGKDAMIESITRT